MHILGIETSSSVCSVGFVNERGWAIERNIEDPHIHSEKLLTLANDVLKQAEADLESLDAIAISIGPGSFTGLRIGLSTAKGLCYALNRKLIGISTFDAIAQAAFESVSKSKKVFITVDAKQGEFYCGSSERGNDGARPGMNVGTRRLDEIDWPRSPGHDSVWITDRPDVIREHGIPSELIVAYTAFCKGDIVARLATTKYQKNEFADLASLEPMYLKDFIVKKALT